MKLTRQMRHTQRMLARIAAVELDLRRYQHALEKSVRAGDSEEKQGDYRAHIFACEQLLARLRKKVRL